MAAVAVWLGLLILLNPAVSQDACPRNCVCFSQSIVCRRSAETNIPALPAFLNDSDGGALQYFAMTSTKLSRVKNGAFTGLLDIMNIDLSNNEIEVIEEGAFRELPVLAHLLLRQNRLSKLPDNAFDFLPSLEELDLSFNRLTNIPPSLQRLVGLKTLNLRGNPLHCGCEIVDFARILPHLEGYLDRATCATPPEVAGKSISELGRQYSKAFEGTRHLGFWPDEYVYQEEVNKKQLIRTNTAWPLPHCEIKDLGGVISDEGEGSSSSAPRPPTIVKAPISVMVAEGERAFFICEATGVPTPKISWVLPTNNTQFVKLWSNRRVSWFSLIQLILSELEDYEFQQFNLKSCLITALYTFKVTLILVLYLIDKN